MMQKEGKFDVEKGKFAFIHLKGFFISVFSILHLKRARNFLLKSRAVKKGYPGQLILVYTFLHKTTCKFFFWFKTNFNFKSQKPCSHFTALQKQISCKSNVAWQKTCLSYFDSSHEGVGKEIKVLCE